ncbi:MAG: antitoxin of toxin-antitoxin stability system [Gammaproteobacteria bacterium]|nr:antitoxin of toxin-antitoxin stability system [Rhodospirillaceae bacterium]MYJ74737.1 antitoxin of toxin-antitoxin stability system [Gammaproteobacteria bacterium]
MPRIIETTVYTIDELSGAAKENARIWYRDRGLHDEWYNFVYEDFETICRIVGVTLATIPVRLYGGGTRDKSQIYWSGFSSQGDGASFAGRYSYARGAARAIRAHAPKDTELHRIADALQAVQRKNFHQLHAYVRQSGRYSHEYTMAIEVERDSPTWQPPTDDAEDTVTEAMRDLARWLYRQLRSEYEHQTSDEAVDEIVADNEWTFTEDGKRFG